MILIDKWHWHTCRICGDKIVDLAKQFGGSGVYYAQIFRRHIRIKHPSITLEEYFVTYCGIPRPVCACGICKQPTNIVGRTKLGWAEYKCGRNKGVQQWSKMAKSSRLGPHNPMFGKKAWNSGLTKDNNESIASISQRLKGRSISDEHRIKLSQAAKIRQIHGHTGCKHSIETIEKLRQHTLQMIKDGRYSQTNTKPQRLFQQILKDLDIKFDIEKIIDAWSFDIYLSEYNVYIEIDGDYFHSNPIIYPDGPQTKTQKVNWYRDRKKDTYCAKHNMVLWRFWEYDIINNPQLVKDRLCTLKR